MSLALWHWHIEISSKCTLRCPRCARQEVPEGLKNTELELEFFWQNFPESFIHQHVEKLTFCGDDGDPIYAHEFLEVIRYFKNTKPSIEIVIVTNGSYKDPDWWHALGGLLSKQDSVHFSIDGYDDASNNQYRVNSNYHSIMTGIRTLRAVSHCQIVWAAIAFSFNEQHLEQMKAQAQALGMDRFQLTRSTKFYKIYPSYGPVDALQPRDELISNSLRFEREVTDFTGRNTEIWPINRRLYTDSQVQNNVRPLCSIGNKGLYISALGNFYPCCWVANRYEHNQPWAKLGRKYNLRTQDLQQVLADNFWQEEFQTYGWIECQTKCASAVVTEEYATQW
jgi:MoaA/NifB/PqqE/SkfB family radical SAM enzyme